MRSRGRRRRPAKRRDPRPLLWLLVVASILAGMAFSPLTAVRKVRVVGSSADDTPRVSRVLQSLADQPLARVDVESLLSRLAAGSDVESAQFQPNLFGRAVVKLKLKKPVARVVNSRVYLDPAGRAFRSMRAFGPLPTIVPPRGALGTNLALAGPWQSGEIAALCSALAAEIPNLGWRVEVTERGVISLLPDSGAEVELGSSEGWPHKIDRLGALLQERPKLLQSVRRINLTYPDAPMVDRG